MDIQVHLESHSAKCRYVEGATGIYCHPFWLMLLCYDWGLQTLRYMTYDCHLGPDEVLYRNDRSVSVRETGQHGTEKDVGPPSIHYSPLSTCHSTKHHRFRFSLRVLSSSRMRRCKMSKSRSVSASVLIS